MSGATKISGELQAGTSGTTDSSAMETEEYYNPEGGEWSQKVDTGQLCRVCANPNEYLIPIFDGEGLEHELSVKIEKHLPIKVTETDALPQQMCYQCASTLIAWHDLVLNCVEADKKLRELQADEDDDDDDKGAEMFESHSMDSDPADEVDQPSTSESQITAKLQVPKKTVLSKDKKPKLKMVLVKGSLAGTSGQKTVAKTQVAKALELAKSKEGGNEDSASERCQPSALMSFRTFLDSQNPWRSLQKTENVLDMAVDIKIEDHSIESRPSCCYCEEYFSTNGELALHLSVSHSSKVFHCGTCDAIFFDSKALFLNHMKSHKSGSLLGKRNLKRSYSCNVCGTVFSSSIEQKNHLKFHKPHEKENGTKKAQNQCMYCNERFPRKFDLKKHMLATHDFKIESVNFTDEKFFLDLPIKEEVDSDEINFAEVVERTQMEHTCDVCRKSFARKNELVKHRKRHTFEELNQMDNIFGDEDDDDNANDYLINHTKIPLEVTSSAETEKKEKDEISRARVEINGRIVYRCDQCNKHIVTRYSYIRHLRIHTGEKPFTCHICGKQFRVQALLSRHVREVHDRIRNHACDICGRRFANSNARNDHRRIHTGERPCVCHLCGKAFKTKASLFVHSKFHSDVFPHPCPHCDKRFRRRQQLDIHILHHTGEKPHTCHFCGKSFRLSKTLKDHTLIHTNKETFECPICGKRFAQERYLKNHTRNHRLRMTNRNILTN